MKSRPLLAGAALIALAAIAVFGWHGRSQLQEMRQTRQALLEELTRRGLPLPEPADPAGREASRKDRHRLRSQAIAEAAASEATATAAELIALSREFSRLKEAKILPDAAARERMVATMDRLMALDAGQLQLAITTILGEPEMDYYAQHPLVIFCLERLSERRPQATLELMLGKPELGEFIRRHTSGYYENLTYQAVWEWSKLSPEAAGNWVTAHGSTLEPELRERLQTGVVQSLIDRDPQQVLSRMAAYGLSGESPLTSILGAQAAHTEEQRIRRVDLLRAWDAALDEEKDGETPTPPVSESDRRSIRNELLSGLALGDSWNPQTFAQSTAFMAHAGLDAEERVTATARMASIIRPEDRPLWIGWVMENLPAETAAERVRSIMIRWTQTDYRGAATWLEENPTAASRQPVLDAYAEALFRSNPQKAREWAETLPNEQERAGVLEKMKEQPVE